MSTNVRIRKFAILNIMGTIATIIDRWLFPPDALTNPAIIMRNTVFAGLIILAIATIFRRSRTWLFDKLWSLRFFMREKRYDRKVEQTVKDLRWRESLKEPPRKKISELSLDPWNKP
jgi:hypothetical protein